VKVPKDRSPGSLRLEVRFDSGPLQGELSSSVELRVVETPR
jgi:hypothetical protein